MLRSIAFNIAFYVATMLISILGAPLLLFPRSWAMTGLRFHARVALWMQRAIIGTRVEVRGLHHLPNGPVIVASKHQSAWDTFGLIPLLRDPALIMKAELMDIPLYGWYSRKFGMIPIRREKGPAALRELLREATKRRDMGREIVIFPEGTRRGPGAPPDYKPGIVLLYEALDVPVCPVALNSGLFWPRRKFARYPGTILVEFLPPIAPGLDRKTFRARLSDAIETACDRLLQQTSAVAPPPPIPQSVRDRLNALGAQQTGSVQKKNIY